jgi:hypothetical protein
MIDTLTAVTPVVPGFGHLEVVYAKDQPEYLPLPVLPVDDGGGQNRIVSRWKLTWQGRLRVLFGGSVYLWVSTFKQPLQPVALTTTPPEMTWR